MTRQWNLDGLTHHDILLQIEDEERSIRNITCRLQESRKRDTQGPSQRTQQLQMLLTQRKADYADLLEQTGV